ncbi:MAG TPA: DbpA RNA binding domain-containing protein, partial [Polyangiaceae bacterium]|nr:DbpA RNA binding domain-containing protein [Polyangiaceae bacterium]
ADQIQMLADAFAARTTDPDDIAMARRLLTHDKAEVIIAGLLRDHLGERPKAVEEAAAARRGRAPRRVEPVPAAPAPKPAAPAPKPAPAPAPASAERAPEPPAPEPREPAARPEREPAAARPEREERRRDDRPAPRLPRRREDLRPPRDHERGAERIEDDDSMDLPRYEVSELPGEPIAAAPVQAPVAAPGAEAAPAKDMSRMSHSAFVDWSPPAQDDDDVPILEAMGDSMTPPPAVEDIPVEDQAELFVNVGRRDGARNEDFMRVLEAAEGLESADVLRIRIRDRHTFVVVRRAVLDRALAALTGARIGSRTANAEIAKPRNP